ncbi:MAG: transcriptional regulator [Chlorobi bacterium]|nr:MAG: helix-turn-helix type 11 domain-containing protein [Chlorobi bacterium OLB7]MBK8911168.1 transcriptional regulator [Chlorobiota bacterium]
MANNSLSASQALLQLLNSGEEFSTVQLMQHLHLSERQVRRILKELEEAGIPVISQFRNRQKYFSIPEDQRVHSIRTIELTDQEMLALSVAAQAATAMLGTTPLSQSLKSSFGKLLHALEPQTDSLDLRDEPKNWHFSDAPEVPIDPAVFRTLRQGIIERRSVRIEYTSSSGKQSSGRKIDPYCLAFRQGSWLLVGYCHVRQAMRNFSIADIAAAQLCNHATDQNATFEIPEDFDSAEAFRDTFYVIGGESHVVRIHVDAELARAFRRKLYSPTQQIEQTLPDGSIIVSMEVAGLKEVANWVLSWGAGVKVMEPKELVETIRQTAGKLAESYRPDASERQTRVAEGL